MGGVNKDSYTIVSAKNAREIFFTMQDDRGIAIPGPLRDITVALKKGKIFVIISSNGVCVKVNKISNDTNFITCIPNGSPFFQARVASEPSNFFAMKQLGRSNAAQRRTISSFHWE